PEETAVLTKGEAGQFGDLTLTHKANGLDQWACSKSLAMLVISLCNRLEDAKIPDEMWRAWLPDGVTSRKALTDEQAQAFINDVERRMKLNRVCSALSVKGVSREVMQQKLSGISHGVTSLKDLNSEQVEKALKEFSHWLTTYNEVVEG